MTAVAGPRARRSPTGWKAALREELGPRGRGRDPHRAAAVRGLAGRDAPAERVARCAAALATSPPHRLRGDVHDVRVRETAEGEIVNFHCRVDPALTVTDVHEKVDDVERALRARFPSIKRVIGHAEPQSSQP